MRVAWLLVAVAMVAAACAAPATETAAPDAASGVRIEVEASSSPAAGGPKGSTTAAVPGEADADGRDGEAPAAPAPDFTLALGDGGSFTLSEEPRPVYLVFWAEW